MKLKPCGYKLYVKPIEMQEAIKVPETLQKMGLVISHGSSSADQRAKMELDVGTLVAAGPLAWKHVDYGYGLPEWDEAWPKIGDKVIFGKYAGKLVTDPFTGEEFMLLNDDDIQSKIEE